MTLAIGRMRLRLPAGYAGRGDGIARALGRALAQVPVTESRAIETLRLGPVRLGAAGSDADVAGAIVQQLRARLEAGR